MLQRSGADHGGDPEEIDKSEPPSPNYSNKAGKNWAGGQIWLKKENWSRIPYISQMTHLAVKETGMAEEKKLEHLESRKLPQIPVFFSHGDVAAPERRVRGQHEGKSLII